MTLIQDLLHYGVEFQREKSGEFSYTREGAHSKKRILFHEDITGKEITSKLLASAKKRRNIQLLEYTAMLDMISRENVCFGAVVRNRQGILQIVQARVTVLATGGIGGLFQRSTNFRHLTGDAVAIALKHGVALKNINYVQIHPTTLYCKEREERSFLISESVRGEGARLYDKHMRRFVNELLPRDQLTAAVIEQMKKDGSEFVWEDLREIPPKELHSHFPNIVAYCASKGYDVTKECIPVVPAQHYFMGGIQVDYQSRTSMEQLYAVGETACNGVHGRNRLASNSLLESLVFAKRAAADIAEHIKKAGKQFPVSEIAAISESENADGMESDYLNKIAGLQQYADDAALKESYRRLVLGEIEKADEEDGTCKL